ncbi:unnamed protein product [Polarella glacialis]|uniref:Uncharacterized protein n=1 Tax=Polarella glacialis TaxID=89957 RepID=A0A813KRW6_POLGL|nr:unnamed protein product [Polarella glacialis]
MASSSMTLLRTVRLRAAPVLARRAQSSVAMLTMARNSAFLSHLASEVEGMKSAGTSHHWSARQRGNRQQFFGPCTPSSEDIFRLRMACETGAPFTGVLMNCRKNGEFFFNLLDLRGLTVARNNVTGKELWFLVGIQADVTDCIELSEDFERARFSDVGPLDHMQQVASSIRANLADKLSALAVSAAMRSSAFEGVKLEDASKDSDPEAWCLLPSPIWKKEPSLPGRRSGTTARSPLESGLPSISVKQPLEFLAVASVSTAAWLCLGSFFYFVSCQK